MASLLTNDVAPFWVWIIVIVVGSMLVILVLAYLVQRCARRQTRQKVTDVEANGLPTRRLTIREGKVISDQQPTDEKSELLRIDAREISTPQSELHDSGPRLSKEKTLLGTPSTIDSPDNSPSATRYSNAPRLSLGSLDGRESFSGFSSVSDLSILSKPSTAVIVESKKPKAVNFSRPQVRAQPQSTISKRNRLSVINESTPRNSFINRIVSWASASNSNDGETKTPDPRPASTEKAPHVSLDFAASQEDIQLRQSPLIDALQELQRLSDAPTPELPCKHPSRTVSMVDDATIVVTSRSSSVIGARYHHGHKRSDSGTNYSRKGAYVSHSRSSSMTNFSRPNPVASAHSRTNSSVYDEPQATLSGPFDALEAMRSRSSIASTWSDVSYHTNRPRAASQMAPTAVSTTDAETSTINTDLLLSGRTSVTPSTSSYMAGGRRSRSRSRSRSRGPVRGVNKKGQAVLRKRSLQVPEITMIGPVDPAILENLSVTDP